MRSARDARRLLGALAAAALLAPGAAAGEVEVALRLGWTVAAGEIERDRTLGALVDGGLPATLEASWRLSRHLSAGAYASYLHRSAARVDPGFRRDNDRAGAEVALSNLRVGVQALLDLLPGARVVPWVGAGLGYEVLSYVQRNGGLRARIDYYGLELLHLQAGASVRLAGLAAGPFVSWAHGIYREERLDLPPTELDDGESTSAIARRAEHGWLQAGLRAAYAF